MTRNPVLWSAVAILFLLLPKILPAYGLDLLVFAAVYTVAGIGVGVLLGQCGILNLAQSVFYAIGAYASAYCTVELGLSSLSGIAIGLVVSGATAFLIGWPTLRLSGYFLALATLALSTAGSELFFEWDWLTGGTFGIGGIPPITIAGFSFQSRESVFYLTWCCVALASLATRNLLSSGPGLAMKAMRSEPDAAAVLGIDLHYLRLKIFVLSAVLGSLAGSLFAHTVGFVSVQSFGVDRSILFLLVPVIGGTRSLLGIVLGGLFVAIVPELLSKFGDIHQVLFGMLLIAVVLAFPNGIAGITGSLRRMVRGRNEA